MSKCLGIYDTWQGKIPANRYQKEHQVLEVRPYGATKATVRTHFGWRMAHYVPQVGETLDTARAGTKCFKSPEALIYWFEN